MFRNKLREGIESEVRKKLDELQLVSLDQVAIKLLEKNAKNQTLIDLIVEQADSIEISLVIEVLDKLTLSEEDIQKLAYASDLKTRAYKHLEGLLNNADHLALLERAVNRQTSIGAFFWKRSGILYKNAFLKEGMSVPGTVERIQKLIVNMSIFVDVPAYLQGSTAAPVLQSQVDVEQVLDNLSDLESVSSEQQSYIVDEAGSTSSVSQSDNSKIVYSLSTVPGTLLAPPRQQQRVNLELSYDQYKYYVGIAAGGLFLVLAVMLAIQNQEPSENNHLKLA
jgi:hypothetical protein